ncbi:NAD-dependent epimerase/dehydratase family protein [Hymenobacter sp. 15J16-1T3B]|uniref:NAD-dependent epimerase/dehydratase family protein n=1 Tax=Hymenobacter sp. 15J16-1T3B TaxID=2886941 RepID=UPI001D11639E|nr:NAD-dependent epimerase/dehydratase family protein [Hymenobacter sp. 15J16-1T3B]MCC3157822.1 NAD-dependent epimerase/dehydratase family protein [Hymenobacter sp. 15J16-1T3B]
MIFVTGGSGLVGSYLIPALLARGLSVRALYRQAVPRHVPGHERVEWVEGDLRDSGVLREALAGVTHVFHCAGLVSYAPQDAELLRQVNVEGTAVVVDACLARPGVRLCYVSSVAALGGLPETATGPELDENAKWDLGAAHGHYATSKYLGETEVWRGMAEGLSAVIVNPSVILGATDWERSSTRLFRYAHQQHSFYTPGKVNFVDVRDVVEAMLRLTLDLAGTGERYILSAGALPLGEFFRQAAACFGKKPPTVQVPDWAAEAIWRLEHLRSLVSGSRPLITKDTARAGRRPVVYQAEKVQRATGLRFRPIEETIRWACSALAAGPNSEPVRGVVVP